MAERSEDVLAVDPVAKGTGLILADSNAAEAACREPPTSNSCCEVPIQGANGCTSKSSIACS